VLSFENGASYTDEDGNEWTNIGDIVISLETLPKNAAYFGGTEDAELKRLLVHGLLHLNGLDHGDEHIEAGKEPECEMLVIQEKLLVELAQEHIM
jgi:probable rRNA maturation factor